MSQVTHDAEGRKLCEGCAPRTDETNHPPGMVFVGWGIGWTWCRSCGGSSLEVTKRLKRFSEDGMHSKFTTETHDEIKLRLLDNRQVWLSLTLPEVTLKLEEAEVLRDELDRYIKAIRDEIAKTTAKASKPAEPPTEWQPGPGPWKEPSKNSDALVALVIFKSCGMGTKLRIRRDGPEAVQDLDLLTKGYAAGVRDELIKLFWSEDLGRVV